MDDSQKKAPRKEDRNNSRKQIFDHNDDIIGHNIDTEKHEPAGNFNRFTEGIELDNIYNDEKPIKNNKKQTKLALYSGRDAVSS